ncbi:hypothetical protein BV25DRAFT_749880 [Artomyces pyxidatus]|uniref:Uncharacterized protein n=1 Tax=Artomyces pyxidatus TaxID=48021 RepID=A0ACB8SZD3_9AGAM|nr:hypothetical protein BV25DRAFT_749880 [Artomyces pyxidatus]
MAVCYSPRGGPSLRQRDRKTNRDLPLSDQDAQQAPRLDILFRGFDTTKDGHSQIGELHLSVERAERSSALIPTSSWEDFHSKWRGRMPDNYQAKYKGRVCKLPPQVDDTPQPPAPMTIRALQQQVLRRRITLKSRNRTILEMAGDRQEDATLTGVATASTAGVGGISAATCCDFTATAVCGLFYCSKLFLPCRLSLRNSTTRRARRS